MEKAWNKAILKDIDVKMGLTHATIYLLKGNFKMAMQANPTVFLWVIVLTLFFVDRYIHKLKIKIFPYLFIIASIITIAWYLFLLLN